MTATKPTPIKPEVDDHDDLEVMNYVGAALVLTKEIDTSLFLIGGEGGHINPTGISTVSSLVTSLDLIVEHLAFLSDDQHHHHDDPAPAEGENTEQTR